MEGGHFYVFEGGGLYYPFLCYIFSPFVMNLFDNLDHAMQLVEDLLRDYMISIFDWKISGLPICFTILF